MDVTMGYEIKTEFYDEGTTKARFKRLIFHNLKTGHIAYEINEHLSHTSYVEIPEYIADLLNTVLKQANNKDWLLNNNILASSIKIEDELLWKGN